MTFGRTKIREALAEIDVEPRKSRGQNFLCEQPSAVKILKFAELQPGETVLEIGPGLGALSGLILETTPNYFAVDIEEKFCKRLSSNYPNLPASQVICSDIREVDLRSILKAGAKLVVIGNIPYSISSPVIKWIIDNREFISRASLLSQKEFARRISAKPNTKDYGSLTIFTSLFANTELGGTISGNQFFPPAQVDSQLVKIIPLPELRFPVEDVEFFSKVVRAGFASRRKTILNNYVQAELLPSKEEAVAFLKQNNIDPQRRGETLNIEEYYGLYRALKGAARLVTP